MVTFFQSIASNSYTFREVAAYVTIAVCMSFAIGFLIAAYTRIFYERDDIKRKASHEEWFQEWPKHHDPT